MHNYAGARTSEVATLVTIPEAALRLGVSPDTIRRRIKAGELPAVLFAGKYRISPADLDALLQRETAA